MTGYDDIDDMLGEERKYSASSKDDIDDLLGGEEAKRRIVERSFEKVAPIEAPINEVKMMDIDSKSYVSTLKEVGYSDENSQEALKTIEGMGTLKIDGRGYSPDVAEMLGNDYLGTGVMIFDRKQKDLGTVEHYSFTDDVVNEIFASCSNYIDRFIQDTPVYSTFSVDLADGRLNVSGKVSTTAKLKEKLDQARDKINDITLDQLMDRQYLEKLTEETRDLRTVYGDIMNMSAINEHYGHTIDAFTLKSESTNFYFISEKDPIGVFFGEPLSIGKINQINGDDRGRVIDVLSDAGLIHYDGQKKDDFIESEERAAFRRAGFDPRRIDEIMEMKKNDEDYLSFMREWKKVKHDLPLSWEQVTDGRYSDLNEDTRLKLISTSFEGKKGKIVKEILRKLERN